MFSQDEINALKQSIVLGTSRKPVEVTSKLEFSEEGGVPGRGELASLALMAQKQRLEQTPRLPELVEGVKAPVDDRPVLPDSLRADFRRLVKRLQDLKHVYLLKGLDHFFFVNGLRLHPFDVSFAIESKQFTRCLGPFEHWYKGQTGIGQEEHVNTSGYVIDEENWTDFFISERVRYLRDVREEDPDKGLSLLQSVFSGEVAEKRHKLLGALEVNCNENDLEFLKSLNKDRSPRVRGLATLLIARVPGTKERDELLQDAFVLFVVGEGRKKTRLKPEAKRNRDSVDLTADLLASVSIEHLSGKFGLKPEEFVKSIASDEALVFDSLVASILMHRNFSLMDLLFAKTGYNPFSVSGNWNNTKWEDVLEKYSADEQQIILEKITDVNKPFFLQQFGFFAEDTFDLFGPLSVEMFRKVRAGKAWKDIIKQLKADKTADMAASGITKFALLTPVEEAETMLNEISAITQFGAMAAQQYWRFLHNAQDVLKNNKG